MLSRQRCNYYGSQYDNYYSNHYGNHARVALKMPAGIFDTVNITISKYGGCSVVKMLQPLLYLQQFTSTTFR